MPPPQDKEPDHPPPSSAGVKNVQSYLHFPIDLHGIVPNSEQGHMPFKVKIYSWMTKRVDIFKNLFYRDFSRISWIWYLKKENTNLTFF
jgi:hypothetical protein